MRGFSLPEGPVGAGLPANSMPNPLPPSRVNPLPHGTIYPVKTTRRRKKQVLHSASHCFSSALYTPSPKHP
ncbi:hypothetical protein RK21_04847 [Pseudomonas plecoglossicida]|nr:hypothetical protein RK21_04847 [Pseudomonas plecoglossicida]